MATLRQYAAGLGARARDTLSEFAVDPDIPLTLVSGNMKSDMDSIVSAFLYAYLLEQQAETASLTPIPVVKCRREDMQMRSDTVYLLQCCGVDAQQLIFLDDECAEALISSTSRVVLTNHNAADGPLTGLGDIVVEIIDNHRDLGQHEQVQGDRRNIAFQGQLATAASTCTIVSEKFLAHPRGKEILARDNGAAARALLGAILVNSSNLDPKANKVCDRDVAVARQLMQIAPQPSQQDLYDSLVGQNR